MAEPQVVVYLVPVFGGELVVFDIEGRGGIEGRWLPWSLLEYRANPYEAASALADTWCEVGMDDLRLVDVLSFAPEGGWELALVFRAELAEAPPSSHDKRPAMVAAGALDAIGPFDPMDLERWLADQLPPLSQPPGSLVF